MAITLTQIRAFLAVKGTGSVHGAAGQLLVSQPSVSAALASLARELGTVLFERHGRGVRLTESGEAFAPYAAEVLGLLEQGRNAAQEAAHPENAKVRLVAVNTAGEYLAPPLIQAYRQLHPGVSILLEVGNRATVFERLESRRADIGIGGRPAGRSLAGYPLVGNELIVVGREIPADLARTPWLLREEGSGTRLATERLLADLDLGSAESGAPEVLTLGSNGAIKQGLVVGLGVTLDLAVRCGPRTAGRHAVRDRRRRHAIDSSVACPVLPIRATTPGGPRVRRVPPLCAGPYCHRKNSMNNR